MTDCGIIWYQYSELNRSKLAAIFFLVVAVVVVVEEYYQFTTKLSRQTSSNGSFVY